MLKLRFKILQVCYFASSLLKVTCRFARAIRFRRLEDTPFRQRRNARMSTSGIQWDPATQHRSCDTGSQQKSRPRRTGIVKGSNHGLDCAMHVTLQLASHGNMFKLKLSFVQSETRVHHDIYSSTPLATPNNFWSFVKLFTTGPSVGSTQTAI
jgi:hypothetical protein